MPKASAIARSLTRRYVLALAALGALATLALFTIETEVARQIGNAELVNVAGRQRMLSQRAVLFAQRLTFQSGTERQLARRELISAVDNLLRANAMLADGKLGGIAAPEMSPTLRQIYFGGANSINNLLHEFAAAARSVALKSEKGPVPQDDPDLQFINWVGPTRLLAKLDSAVSHYQAHGEEAIEWLRLLEVVAWLAGLLVLTASGVFIFAPMVRQLKSNLEKADAATAALAESEERFVLAAQGANVGLRDHFNLKQDEEYWSPQFYRMLGYTPGVLAARRSTFNDLLHPDDRDRVREALQAHVVDHKPLWVECRLQDRSEQYLWFLMTGQATWNNDGTPRRLITSFVDIDARKSAEERKSEFVAIVAHELRTPLTSIGGALSLVESKALGPLSDQSSRFIAIARENCLRLIRLINELLDVEKIESGRVLFDFQPACLGALLERAKEQNDAFAVLYNAKIVVDPVPLGIFVEVDDERFEQVMTNLLSNAAKYSPEGGEIRVSAEVLPERVRISVSDQGPGISPEFRPLIFNKFAQAGGDMKRKDSTGLGLSIAKAIVEAHGGRIMFDTQEGEGTTFYFDVPLCDAAALEARDADTRAPSRAKVALARAQQDHAVTIGSGPASRPARILYIGQEAESREKAGAALKGLAQTTFSDNCEEASAILRRRAFDLVILDLHQPSASGERSLECLRGCGRLLPPVLLYASRRIVVAAWPEDLRALVAAQVNDKTLRGVVVDELRSFEEATGERFKKSA